MDWWSEFEMDNSGKTNLIQNQNFIFWPDYELVKRILSTNRSMSIIYISSNHLPEIG